jgi:hypothetical protein
MTERRIRLDIAAGGRADHQSPRSGAGGERDPASQEEIDRFRSVLAGGAPAGEGGDYSGPPPEARDVGHARGAFDLFGQAPRDARDRDARDPAGGCAAKLADEVAERILVSDDDGHEARVYIRDDVLPGVELRLRQAEGRWVISFLVTDVTSFALLEQHGARIADELAGRLQSAVEVELSDPRGPDAERVPARTFFAEPPTRYGS